MIVTLRTRRPAPGATLTEDLPEAGPQPDVAAPDDAPEAPPEAPGAGLLDRWPAEADAAAPPPVLDLAPRDPLGLWADGALVDEAARLVREAAAKPGAVGAAAALAQRLEAGLARLVGCGRAVLRPGRASAGAATMRALVRRGDHVLVDNFAAPALGRAAEAAGADVHRYPHGSVEAVARWLDAIRMNSPRAGVLVVTGSLPARGGAAPDLARLQGLAREKGATLLVDLGADLGAMGEGGGMPDAQGLRGAVDVVTGDLLGLCGVPAGFAASSRPGLAAALTAAPGPEEDASLAAPQAALAVAAVEWLVGPAGARARDRLLVASCGLALALRREGFEVTGAGAPVLHVALGREAGRRMTAALTARGVALGLLEGPGGDGAGSRWRLGASVGLGRAEAEAAARLAREVADGERARAEAPDVA